MSVIIVLAVPLGPSPCWIKRGVMVGKALELDMAAFVVVGLGLYTVER